MKNSEQLGSPQGDRSVSTGSTGLKGWRAIWLCSGLIGSGLLGLPVAWARPMLNDTTHFLVAQRVVDGLPPPPPVIFGQESLAGQPQTAQAQRYLVVVGGDNRTMLSQVQQVQPTASIQQYNGQRFIQAGLFNDVNAAQQQVKTLAASGVTAQVVPVAASVVSQTPTYPANSGYGANSGAALPPPEGLPTTTVPSVPAAPAAPTTHPREVEFGGSSASPAPSSTSATASGNRAGRRGYYVIIPSSGRDMSAVTNQISRLTDGLGVESMIQSGTARGAHIKIGPFSSRDAAGRWTRYFRDFGMDARVNYGR
jgi:hypothetical protein